MRRAWLDLWSFAAALALAAAILLRWRRGQVAMISSSAAPAIRLLALLFVFLQGCADKLRGKDEPGGQGVQPGLAGAGQPDGQGAAGGAGQGGPAGDLEGGASDMSDGSGANKPGQSDIVSGPPLDADFPIADQAALARCVGLLSDQGWHASAYKQLARLLATVTDGTGPNDPVWADLLLQVDGIRARGLDQAARDAFVDRLRAHIEARRDGKADTVAELQALLVAAEALPLFDTWLAGYVWRRAAPLAGSASARAELLARIERHLRVRHALLKGQLDAGPVEFTAWRSKAGPPPGWTGIAVPPGLLEAARNAYPSADAGTWETAGTLALTVRSEGLALIRRGQATPLAVGQQVVLRRLDLLQAGAPATLRHDELGDMSINAGSTVSAWDVGDRLGAAARARVKERVAAALGGDAAALKRLEAILPAAHAEIRAAVAARPDAPGAAGLRMLLALFDE